MLDTTLISIIYWAVDPELFSWGFLHPRWYGLFFAGGFLLAYYFLGKIFQREGRDEYQAYLVFIYVFVGTLIGARLGHILFYDPLNYFSNPLDIFKIWEGGLASHGATAGIAIALWLYAKKHTDKPLIWTVDRVSVTAPIASAMIRLGNLMNSEIVGVQTDLPWGFVFGNRVDLGPEPRHPAQLYEALCYFIIFVIVWKTYQRYGKKLPAGLTTGIILSLIFSARFFIEFIKIHQENFSLGLPLDMGQLLSVPFAGIGFWLWIRARRQT